MTAARLVLRSLAHYWRTGVVVVVGLAVATAVIVGSLVIGDSIQGSIRRTALGRLGVIFDAVTAPRFFRAALAEEANIWGHVEALIRVDGSARAEGSDAVIANVSVVGIDDGFWGLYPDASSYSLDPRSAIINEALAEDAGVAEGETLLITVSRPGEAMADTLFARREREETLATLRVMVEAILPDLGPGGFRLDPSTAMPRNVLVDREWLAEQIDEPRKANTVVLGPVPGPDGTYPAIGELRRTAVFGPSHPSRQRQQIKQAMTLEDHGLYLRRHGSYVSLFTEAITLTEAQIEAARQAADGLGLEGPRARRTSVYLADAIEVVGAPSRSIAYAVVANLHGKEGLPPIEGRSETGHAGVWLNEWALQDLGVGIGDGVDLRVRWRVSTPSGYEDRSAELPLGGVVAMRGLGADPGLVPDFEGITDAEHIDEWEPPFPIDLSRVSDRDEQYWDRYRAAPRAFVSTDLLKRMWQGPDGTGPWVTSVRIRPESDPSAFVEDYRQALLAELEPQDAGIAVRPVREQALEASKGTSDFSGLFLGMSMFLVFAGAGLGGTLMRLSADRRASQAGIMLATGFTARDAGRTVAAEGVMLSLIGTAIGTPLGVLYAHGIIRALATWWEGALGNAPALGLFVDPLTVMEGAAAALLVGVIATLWGVRAVSARPVLELLRGWQTAAVAPSGRRSWTLSALFLLLITATGLLAAALGGGLAEQSAFFGIGAALLLAALAGAHVVLTRAMRLRGASQSTLGLTLRSAASARGRSLLLVGLIAAATFVIVTVAANSRDFSGIDTEDRASGTGGFSLVATSSVPLRFDPATEEGRENLGFLPDEQEALADTVIISLPRSPGEDISCLNIARPTHPRLLGVTDEMIRRGGFPVTPAREPPGGNPWRLLSEEEGGGSIPAIGDAASVQWQLHSGLGKTYELNTPRGTRQLRFAGLLRGSIFQSELLVREDELRRLYPDIRGPSYFLVDTPEGHQERVAEALRSALGDMGVEVRTTREVLNSYIQVQNTYLTMFLALGGLGLLLGTIGLVAVILRSAFERRSEFALMLATGFTRTNLTWLLTVENAGLLVAGIAVGTITALIAVAPHLASAQANVNWRALLAVLAGILIVGAGSCVAGARSAVRGELIEALRSE
ncbi:MAG: ABC transporter permease [Armatimonadota bacterium]|nr:ABC transporter permease [Armatimonadota bacterium]